MIRCSRTGPLLPLHVKNAATDVPHDEGDGAGLSEVALAARQRRRRPPNLSRTGRQPHAQSIRGFVLALRLRLRRRLPKLRLRLVFRSTRGSLFGNRLRRARTYPASHQNPTRITPRHNSTPQKPYVSTIPHDGDEWTPGSGFIHNGAVEDDHGPGSSCVVLPVSR